MSNSSSLGILAVIAAFTSITFAQNIVNGGRPPIFLTTNVEDQNGVVIFILFVVNFIILFSVTSSVVEYRNRNVKKLNIDLSLAISSHPLLLKEETPKILLKERLAVRLDTGVTNVEIAITRSRIFISSFSTILMTKEIGRIFCQVITTSMEFCFISMFLISFMYQRWVGHAPIFIKIENTKMVEEAVVW